MLAIIEVRSIFIKEIKVTQFADDNLNKFKNKKLIGQAKQTTVDVEGVLNFKGRICLTRLDDN